MNDENRNLLLAVLLSAALLFGWQYFFAKPQLEQARANHALSSQQPLKPAPSLPGAPAGLSRNEALSQSGSRIAIDTPSLDGTIQLKGARFDDLRLKKYRETQSPKSAEIVLFSPEKTPFPYFAAFGWQGPATVKTPDDSTPWSAPAGARLTPASPVTLTWDNGQGLVFSRVISVDQDYLFHVRDTVTNHTSAPVSIAPTGTVERVGLPKGTQFTALHEGFVGVSDGILKDAEYQPPSFFGTLFGYTGPPQKFPTDTSDADKKWATNGWFGITDKYWMAAVVPPQNASFAGGYDATSIDSTKIYHATYALQPQHIDPNQSVTVEQRLFAGAKVYALLQKYETQQGITNLHYAIDWGWFWFFTQPIFLALDFLARYINMGLAIMLLTVIIKLAFFPLADASYRSMSRMKKLQPEMERIKTRFADDQPKQQQEIMDLYRREKINPVSGCLPMLVQIPVFYSLYKVLLGSIEMRQAPFLGWIHDLSAPDPTSILNLFGLLPYNPHVWLPEHVPFAAYFMILNVGIWPIFMGMTQWLQTKLNPPATDPVQQQMFTYMPIAFTFMLASMPAGLVIYWTWNNLLSVTQQYIMMRRQGVEVHLFKNFSLPFFGNSAAPKTPALDGKRQLQDGEHTFCARKRRVTDEEESARKLFAGACDFVAGAAVEDAIPAPVLPEIAFAGRSNVGKSTLINALTRRATLARVSHTPGRTQQINFFNLGSKLMLVDLPGYGYARASKSLSAQWQRLIFDYLRGRPNLKRVILLIDSRRGIMDVDNECMTLLDRAAVSYLTVLTKIDELNKSEREEARPKTALALKGHVAAYPEILATSSLKQDGIDALRLHIAALATGAGFGL